jgi:predicted nucleotidyltransferase
MVAPVDEIRRKIEPTLRKFGVVRAALFGSAARGEARAASDLDFLVELESGRSLLDLVGLKFELTDILGVETDVVTYRSLHPRMREQVLREQLPLL